MIKFKKAIQHKTSRPPIKKIPPQSRERQWVEVGLQMMKVLEMACGDFNHLYTDPNYSKQMSTLPERQRCGQF